MDGLSTWNPRFVAYAQEAGRTPDQQLVHDRRAFPGGCMAGFILWISGRKQAFFRAHPEAMLDRHTILNQAAWDLFLGAETSAGEK